jgi:hypothetical protein
MPRRWAKPKPKPPQADLFASQRPKAATDTSLAAMESVGALATSMVGVLDRHARRTRLAGAMLAVTVRKEVLDFLRERPGGATADEIAAAIGRSILTVRPRVSELKRLGAFVDSGERRANASGHAAAVMALAQRELGRI